MTTNGVSAADSTNSASTAQYRFLKRYGASSEYPNVGIGLVPDFDYIPFDGYGDNMASYGAGYVPPQNWNAPALPGGVNTIYDPITMQRRMGYPPAEDVYAPYCHQNSTYGPAIEKGMTQKEINDAYEKWEDHQLERQIEKQEKAEAARIKLESANDIINDKLHLLRAQINREEQDKIGPGFETLVAAIKDKYLVDGKLPKGMSEEKLDKIARTEARKIYANTFGVSLSDDIDAKGSGAFWQGFKQTFGFGMADVKCKNENLALVEGDQAPQNGAKAGKIAGSVVGFGTAIGTGAAIGAGIGVWFGVIGAGPGAAIGAAVGAIGRAFQGFFS